jgi:hypothetical protein
MQIFNRVVVFPESKTPVGLATLRRSVGTGERFRFRLLRFCLLALSLASLIPALYTSLRAADNDMLPPQLTKDQRENLLRFLQRHEKPDRYVPADAKIVSTQPATLDTKTENALGKPIKQYMVQITSHRPVPGQEEVKRVDVYYYRPNPEKGKPGITIRHTVDLDTGKQVGTTEVLLNSHTPISHEELTEAVELAREKSPAVAELYKGRAKNAVRWEYLQLMINRKHEQHEPGDRVVRIVFTAPAAGDEEPPLPVRVIVNLTKGVVSPDAR